MPLTLNWKLLKKIKNFQKRLAKTKPAMALLSGAFTGNDKTKIWQDFHFKYTSRFSK
jgi:hypothetical protein